VTDLVERGRQNDGGDDREDQPRVVDDLARASRDAVHQIQPHMSCDRGKHEHDDHRWEEEEGEGLHDRVGDLGPDERHLQVDRERTAERARALGRRRGISLRVEDEAERDELLQQTPRVVRRVRAVHLFGETLRDVVDRLVSVDLLEGAVQKLGDLDERAVALGEPLLLRVARVLELAGEIHVRREARRIADLRLWFL
jgi:hypothetical protein